MDDDDGKTVNKCSMADLVAYIRFLLQQCDIKPIVLECLVTKYGSLDGVSKSDQQQLDMFDRLFDDSKMDFDQVMQDVAHIIRHGHQAVKTRLSSEIEWHRRKLTVIKTTLDQRVATCKKAGQIAMTQDMRDLFDSYLTARTALRHAIESRKALIHEQQRGTKYILLLMKRLLRDALVHPDPVRHFTHRVEADVHLVKRLIRHLQQVYVSSLLAKSRTDLVDEFCQWNEIFDESYDKKTVDHKIMAIDTKSATPTTAAQVSDTKATSQNSATTTNSGQLNNLMMQHVNYLMKSLSTSGNNAASEHQAYLSSFDLS